MKKILFSTLSMVGLLLIACQGTGSQGNALMSSTGRSSEVLVVCPTALWNAAYGDSLRSVLEETVPALPQSEPQFLVSQIDNSSFKPLYQKQRNIILMETDPSLEDAKLKVEKNKWASPQICIHLKAKDMKGLTEAFMSQSEQIVEYIRKGEMARFQKAQRAQEDNSIRRSLEEKYRLSMVLPDGFIFAVKTDSFCWMRKETKYWGQHVMIYTEPYTDTTQFSPRYIRELRDRYTRQYVQGSADSSHALVDDRFYPVESRYYAFPASSYAIESRGLWGVFGHPGDHMGGPFVSYTFLDEEHQQVVTVDGFLYAPSDKKRDLMRQVEAILLSTSIVKSKN